jgi:hypothetical protein
MEMTERGKSSSESPQRLHRRQIVLLLVVVLVIENS